MSSSCLEGGSKGHSLNQKQGEQQCAAEVMVMGHRIKAPVRGSLIRLRADLDWCWGLVALRLVLQIEVGPLAVGGGVSPLPDPKQLLWDQSNCVSFQSD